MYVFPKYSEYWQEVSRKTRKRDQQCVRCGTKGTLSNKLIAHHIIPKSKGGKDNLLNTITLCEKCHQITHPHMKRKEVKI